MRLSEATRARLPAEIAQPDYDCSQPTGIVHFGIGAFHRAHQAWYTDACLRAGERGWMITGVSLRSSDVAEQLNPQDGLYTLTERSGEGASTRLVGSVREVLVAARARAAIVARIAAPACHLVSFTVTEKGYCRAPDGSLDLALAGAGFYPILTDALRQRRYAGLPGITLLSCDNLAANGQTLRRLMGEWLGSDAELSGWFARDCTTPASMVDRIVPATTPQDISALADRIAVSDEGAVVTEPFSQWVIEDDFAGPRPRWEDHGAQIVADVAPYETAKLRMLNGAHSLLAYCGLLAGHEYVHQAIADPRLRMLAKRLMLEEAAPTIASSPGLDLGAYAGELLARFANPALNHRLSQIAMDGSQKIPQRWLATRAERAKTGAQSPCIEEGMQCWLRHLANGRDVNDPLQNELRATIANSSPEASWANIFGEGGILSA